MASQVESIARLKDEAAALGITAATKVSEYMQARFADEREREREEREREREDRIREREDRLRAEEREEEERIREREDRLREENERIRVENERARAVEREHEKEMAHRQQQIAERQRDNESDSDSKDKVVHAFQRVKLNPFRESDDIDAFVGRFERVANLYRMEDEEKAVEFFSLFTGKALSIIHLLDKNHSSYEHMKAALQKAYGRTADEAKQAFRKASICENETAVQALARISRYFDERLTKEGVVRSFEDLRELMIKDRLEEMCPLELVVSIRCQGRVSAEKLAESYDRHVEVYRSADLPYPPPSAGDEIPQPGRAKRRRKSQSIPSHRSKRLQNDRNSFQGRSGLSGDQQPRAPPLPHRPSYAAAANFSPQIQPCMSIPAHVPPPQRGVHPYTSIPGQVQPCESTGNVRVGGDGWPSFDSVQRGARCIPGQHTTLSPPLSSAGWPWPSMSLPADTTPLATCIPAPAQLDFSTQCNTQMQTALQPAPQYPL